MLSVGNKPGSYLVLWDEDLKDMGRICMSKLDSRRNTMMTFLFPFLWFKSHVFSWYVTYKERKRGREGTRKLNSGLTFIHAYCLWSEFA